MWYVVWSQLLWLQVLFMHLTLVICSCRRIHAGAVILFYKQKDWRVTAVHMTYTKHPQHSSNQTKMTLETWANFDFTLHFLSFQLLLLVLEYVSRWTEMNPVFRCVQSVLNHHSQIMFNTVTSDSEMIYRYTNHWSCRSGGIYFEWQKPQRL